MEEDMSGRGAVGGGGERMRDRGRGEEGGGRGRAFGRLLRRRTERPDEGTAVTA